MSYVTKRTRPYALDRRAKRSNVQMVAKKYRKKPTTFGRFQKVGGPENKNFDYQNLSVTPQSDVTVSLLINPIQQGNTALTMVGRRVTMTSLLINYSIFAGIAASTVTVNQVRPEIIRVIIFCDREPETTLATGTELLSNVNYLGPLNLANTSRFTVLYDERHQLGGIVTTGTSGVPYSIGEPSVYVSKYIKMKLPMEGPSTAGGITGINAGALYCYAISSGATSTTAGNATMQFNSRVRFVDN